MMIDTATGPTTPSFKDQTPKPHRLLPCEENQADGNPTLMGHWLHTQTNQGGTPGKTIAEEEGRDMRRKDEP
jgi:hypothetical protein